MRFSDMLKMSLSNLWKRKIRTFLTVLGVVIGVASIIVMVSLGIGLRTSTMEDLENYASLTQVQVNAPFDTDSSSKNATDYYLSDETVERLKGLEHVVGVSPKLEAQVVAKFGKYIANYSLQGLPPEAIEKLNIKIGEGELPKPGGELSFFYGKFSLQDYYDPRSGDMPFWEKGKVLDVDLMSKPVTVYLDGDSYTSAMYGDGGGEDGPVKMPKKYLIPTAGIEEGFNDSESDYTATAWGIYCDLEALKEALKKEYKNKVIPGQPTSKTGKPYKEIFYNTLLVDVDAMENVTSVQKAIQDLGYNAYSDAEWIAQEQNSMNMIQAVLGGIGAVSLLVAAIGIANTMMMSIYERTKEIGVMKVLGCDMRNIRTMFLMEAGYIGFFGGAVGMGFSYLLSAIINQLVMNSDSEFGGMTISIIPAWLAGLSLIFAVLIGMLAGFFPARRAMKLSALAAIKNE